MSTIKVTNLRHESAAGGNITLDSSGRVGIGETSPTEKLHVSGSGGTAILVADSSDWAGLSLSGSGSSNFIVSDDRLDFLVNGSTRASILTTGGLTFSGDTAAANALDDYEEGSFTPTITGDGFTRTYNSTYTQGRYTKIGRVVTIEVAMYVSSQTGTANGSAPEFNLPFASSSFVSAQHWSLTPLRLAAVASSEIAKIPSLNAMSDTTALRGYYQLSGINNSTSGQVINTSTWGPNYQIGYTLTYVTN